MKQLALDIAAPAAPSLDKFIAGRNAEAIVALYALANGANTESFIYLWGASGCGRTHLLRAVETAARSNDLPVQWFHARRDEHAQTRGVIWIADDVHRLTGDDQIALFNLHNRVGADGGWLLTAGDNAPSRLSLRADLVTRLASGLVYHLNGLNDDEKAAALARHADARGIRLSREVAEYLLRHARRDLPSLLAMLDALDRYSLETKRAITVPLVRELIAP